MEINVRGLHANTRDIVRGVLPKRQSGCCRRGHCRLLVRRHEDWPGSRTTDSTGQGNLVAGQKEMLK